MATNATGSGCNETEGPIDPRFIPCQNYDFVFEAVLMGSLCLFGFCGNTLSMICLSKDKSKTATPFLLVSLEAADTFFLMTVVLLRVFSTVVTYFRVESALASLAYLAKYVYPCAMIAETATIYLTLLVTLNRYVSVCMPYDASSLCSRNHARVHVLTVTLFAIVYNLPRFFEFEIVHPVDPCDNSTRTTRSIESELTENKVYNFVYANFMYFCVMFLVPLLTLIFLNYNLVRALRAARRRRAQLLSDAHSRSEDDITLVLICVVIVFLVCQTPALITQVGTLIL